MISPRVVLLTGATGFVGGAVALELLATTDAVVLALVRGPDAGGRLAAHLARTAGLYGRDDLVPAIGSRVRALTGELTDLTPSAALRGVDLVIHGAAGLSFADRDATELQRVNVEGTRAVVRFAEREAAGRLVYISTAYVAGRRTGVIGEVDPAPRDFHNPYERTKAAAEAVVRESGLDFRIVRPSIVIGHRDTAATTSSAGFYAAVRALSRLRRIMDRHDSPARIRILADPDQKLDLIPVDMVARAVLRIAVADSGERVFHLTNDRAPTARASFTAVLGCLGLPEPEFVTDPGELGRWGRLARTGPLEAYLNSAKTFATANTVGVCGPEATAYPMDAASLERYTAWYLRNALPGIEVRSI